MSFLIHGLVAVLMPLLLKLGRFIHSPVEGRFVTDLYERGDFRLVKVPVLGRSHYVRVTKVRFDALGTIRVSVRHGEDEFWNTPRQDVVLPGIERYEPLFWQWAIGGHPALGEMIHLWHTAVDRYHELCHQRTLLVEGLGRLVTAIEPLRGSGPISLPRILAYVSGLYHALLGGGLVDHAALFEAVNAPLNLGGRKPGA